MRIHLETDRLILRTGVHPNAIRLKDGTLLNEYSMIREIRR